MTWEGRRKSLLSLSWVEAKHTPPLSVHLPLCPGASSWCPSCLLLPQEPFTHPVDSTQATLFPTVRASSLSQSHFWSSQDLDRSKT